MKILTEEQINDIAENCKCPHFQYGDANGHLRLTFARAIEAACQAKDVGFPILRIIENDHLKNGAKIERQDDHVCLIRADGKIVGRGDTLQGLLAELIFILC